MRDLLLVTSIILSATGSTALAVGGYYRVEWKRRQTRVPYVQDVLSIAVWPICAVIHLLLDKTDLVALNLATFLVAVTIVALTPAAARTEPPRPVEPVPPPPAGLTATDRAWYEEQMRVMRAATDPEPPV